MSILAWAKEWIKPSLSLRLTIEIVTLIKFTSAKVSLASQSGKVWQVHTEDFFFLCYNDVHQKLRFFTPDTPILSLFRILE